MCVLRVKDFACIISHVRRVVIVLTPREEASCLKANVRVRISAVHFRGAHYVKDGVNV